MSAPPWIPAPLDAVRAVFARTLLPDADVPARLGEVELWPHQRDAVTRLRSSIAEFRGALLADDVGLGKTFVALAVASSYARPLVVVPAALRDVWRAAAARAGVAVEIRSIEALSRARDPSAGGLHDLVVVDEAHHARNPATKRYAGLARLVAGVDTLLLSATPVHNSRDDLLALLTLFLGGRARALGDGALARCVVRRSRDDLDRGPVLPRVDGPHPIVVATADDDIVEAILELPPAVPAADGGRAHALAIVTMVRQWSSSAAALRGGIRRRLAQAHALETSLDAGRHPTRGELAAWTLGDDAQQLSLPALLAPADAGPVSEESLAALRAAVARHRDALGDLSRRLAARGGEVDRRRSRALLDAWRAHPGDRLLAFTQFAETVDAYWRELRVVPRICTLTAASGRMASGAVGRSEVFAAFAPHAPASAAHRRIDAVIATDVASEGVDLQGASVLAHLDLPWTAARLEQRLGRVRRPGAAAPVVHVYVVEPPVRAATMIAIRERLAAKLAAARLALGDVMPDIGIAAADERAAPPALAESVRRRLARWRSASASARADRDRIVVAAARVDPRDVGWLALLEDGDRSFLVASVGGREGDHPAAIEQAIRAVGEETSLDPRAAERALGAVLAWSDARHGARLAGAEEVGGWSGRRQALADLAAAAASPRSRRSEGAAELRRARSIATGTMGLAGERRLAELGRRRAQGSLSWLDDVALLARFDAPDGGPRAPRRARLRAIILLSPV